MSKFIAEMRVDGLAIPEDARGLLVVAGDNGQFIVQAVEHGESVLNVRRDLFDHLTEQPYTTEFLEELQAYCAARIEARRQARQQRVVTMPGAGKNEWQMIGVARQLIDGSDWPFTRSTDPEEAARAAEALATEHLRTGTDVSAVLADAYQCRPNPAAAAARAAYVGAIVALAQPSLSGRG